MTTSNFNQDRNSIIQDAFFILRVYGMSESIKNSELEFAARQLNRMVKIWERSGMKLWTQQEGQLFLSSDTQSYSLNSTSGDHAAATSDVITTTILSDEAAGQTTLSLTDTTGMAANDYIGIELDDGTRQWTTIVSVPTSTSVTITAALTDSATADNTVYTYTTRLDRPLELFNARYHDSSAMDRVLTPMSKSDYMRLVNKAVSSMTSQYYYDSSIGTGKLYIWPTADNVVDRIFFTYRRQLNDFDLATDNPDFPQEWLDAIIYGLAARLISPFGLKNADSIRYDAERYLREAMNADEENTDINSTPDFGSYPC